MTLLSIMPTPPRLQAFRHSASASPAGTVPLRQVMPQPLFGFSLVTTQGFGVVQYSPSPLSRKRERVVEGLKREGGFTAAPVEKRPAPDFDAQQRQQGVARIDAVRRTQRTLHAVRNCTANTSRSSRSSRSSRRPIAQQLTQIVAHPAPQRRAKAGLRTVDHIIRQVGLHRLLQHPLANRAATRTSTPTAIDILSVYPFQGKHSGREGITETQADMQASRTSASFSARLG